MPPKNPRDTVVLEPTLYNWLKKNAGKRGMSVSQAIRDIVRNAYREQEGAHWMAEGENRLGTFSRKNAFAHEAAWK